MARLAAMGNCISRGRAPSGSSSTATATEQRQRKPDERQMNGGFLRRSKTGA